MSDAASSAQPALAADAGPSSSSVASSSLLAALQAGVAPLLSSPRLPRGALRLHALFSAPRPALELFPFAHVGGSSSGGAAAVGAPLEARVEHVLCTAAWSDEEEDELAVVGGGGDEGQAGGEASQAMSLASQLTTSDAGSGSTTAAGPGGRSSRLIYALECFLYTVPSTRAAILYVSKLDSSGWAPAVLPAALLPFLSSTAAAAPSGAEGCSLVRAITTGFLRHFASLAHWAAAPAPVEHCSIHVLARAQPAYLFPSSPDNPAKHVLSDGKLIAWWRSVLSDVARDEKRAQGRNFYIVPGYDERMSTELLPLPPREGDSALARARWLYGHPYSRAASDAPPLPLHRAGSVPAGIDYSTSDASAAGAIATLMPHFPDDPKSRFIAEIARDAHELHAPGTQSTSNAESQTAEPAAKRQRLELPAEPGSAASQQSFDEVASQTTSSSAGSSQGTRLSSSVRKLQRERAALDAVSPDEFWERMGFRQECCAGNAVGVFVCIYDAAAGEASAAASAQAPPASKQSSASSAPTTSTAQRMALAHTTLPDLIRRHMMRDACDWSSRAAAASLTRAWNEGVRRAILRKGGLSAAEAEQADERLGEDVVWTDVRVQGSSKEVREEARRRWEEAGKPMPQVTNSEPPRAVNALSVKRKKKPPPAP